MYATPATAAHHLMLEPPDGLSDPPVRLGPGRCPHPDGDAALLWLVPRAAADATLARSDPSSACRASMRLASSSTRASISGDARDSATALQCRNAKGGCSHASREQGARQSQPPLR